MGLVVSAPASSSQPANLLVNSAFDFWQAGVSASVTATGGGTPTPAYLYQADQWYVKNILGGGTVEGVIAFNQVTGVTNGSKFGASVQITTAPTGAGIQNGCEFWQVLSNRASLPLYGQTASFTVLVKAFNNVNQIGVQFFYATSEAKPSVAIGSEILTTVNNSTFTACTTSGQALGTAQTLSGVIGVRIRITGVSSGNTYDLNNGFTCEQAMLNIGTTAGTFTRQYNNPAEELASCQYFYEVLSAAGGNFTVACGFTQAADAQTEYVYPFKVSKRANATPSVNAASSFNVANASTNAAATGFVDLGTGTDTSFFRFTVNPGYAANSGVAVLSNVTTARMFFDSRI